MNLVQGALKILQDIPSPTSVWKEEASEMQALRESQRRRRIQVALGTEDLVVERFAHQPGFDYLVTGGMLFEEEEASLPDQDDNPLPCRLLFVLATRQVVNDGRRGHREGRGKHLIVARFPLWSHLDLPRILGENQNATFDATIVLAALSDPATRVNGSVRAKDPEDTYY